MCASYWGQSETFVQLEHEVRHMETYQKLHRYFQHVFFTKLISKKVMVALYGT